MTNQEAGELAYWGIGPEEYDDEMEPDSCDFCGGDLEDDAVFWCNTCHACVCSSDCAEGHIEEEHGTGGE